MNKYAITAVNENPDYLFFAPIWAAFWERLGYIPYVIIVNKGISKNLSNLIEKSITRIGGVVKYLDPIPGYKTSTTAQICRLYASSDNFFRDSDYLITDDVDKYVISRPWFNQQDTDKDIHIFDIDETNYTRLKIGYIGMTASLWKKILNIPNKSLYDNVKDCLESNLGKDPNWDSSKILSQQEKEIDKGWNLDEYILTKNVFKSPLFPDKCQFITRGHNHFGLRNGRIDRAFWKQTLHMYLSTQIIDVHLHRDPYQDEMWNDTKLIMSTVFPPKEIEFYEKYKQNFVKLVEG